MSVCVCVLVAGGGVTDQEMESLGQWCWISNGNNECFECGKDEQVRELVNLMLLDVFMNDFVRSVRKGLLVWVMH